MMDKKFKVSVIRTEYFTNYEKKTVTCKMHYRIKSTDDRAAYALNYISSYMDDPMYFYDDYVVIATAKTSPDDTFDQHKGEQIARAKAESMAYATVAKYLDRVHTWITRNVTVPMSEFIYKANGVLAHNDRYLDTF
jgi:hypothetical protein